MTFFNRPALPVLLLLGLPSALASDLQTRPNIVFILADDLGWNDVSYHGSEIKTPHLDRLAASGVRLEQFYAMPVCTPTRAALMTGLHPMRLGLQLGVIKPESKHGLPLKNRILAQELSAAGYFTAITGKWHLGNGSPDYLPTARGFQHQHGHYLGSTDYFTHERDGGLDWHRNDHALRQEGYATDLIADEAVAIIKDRRDSPFFLYVAFNAPHTPLQATAPYQARYTHLPERRRNYAAMVTQLDDAIGRIVTTLEQQSLLQKTVIIFMSDNGGNLPAASNAPLRDQKGSLYEGGVRVPALVAWQGQLSAGRVVTQPLHVTDWFPTLLALAGLKPAAAVDGKDLWAALKGDPAPIHDEILINAAPGTGALRRGNWKLVVNGQLRYKGGTPPPDFSWADLLRESKLPPEDADRKLIELFDIEKDAGETLDLAGEKPDVLKELLVRWQSYADAAVPLLGQPDVPGLKAPKIWGERGP